MITMELRERFEDGLCIILILALLFADEVARMISRLIAWAQTKTGDLVVGFVVCIMGLVASWWLSWMLWSGGSWR